MSNARAVELRRICRSTAGLVTGILDSRWAGVARPAGTVPPAPSLEDIEGEVRECVKCALHETRKNTVFGEGDAAAAVMFVGEAPGAEEDRQGRPFVGKAGQLLDRIIGAMGLERRQVFIANVLKCRPPGNRNPERGEIASCLPYLHAQMDLVKPKVICALGKFAAQSLLETDEAISRLRGRFHDYRGTPLMPTFHPAYLLRNERDKALAWQDMQQIMSRCGLTGRGGAS